MTNKLTNIEKEIKDGLKLKACDKLRNLINQYPNDLSLYDKLANVYFESGFYDAAGKYWILIEPKNENIRSCVDIYKKSVNNSGTKILQDLVLNPLKIVGKEKDLDISVKVLGGGIKGQAGAVAHGIARALVNWNEELKPLLKAEGLMTRDSRTKERKKDPRKKDPR